MLSRIPAAPNAVSGRVTDYAPDARGTSLFGALSEMAQRGISGHSGVIHPGDKGCPEGSFNGDLGRPVQAFMGAAALALYGAAKPSVAQSNDLVHAISTDTLDDAPFRIFAARARREGSL